MNKWISILVLSVILSSGIAAEKVIELPEPDKTGGKPLMQALTDRKTIRSFSTQPLTEEELSDLLYAATGVNRPDGRRTVPSALNSQDITLYVAMKDGLYRYDPAKHELILEQERDLRPFCGMRKEFYTTAPLTLIPVSDLAKMKTKNIPEEQARIYAPLHIGCVVQNIYLYAASAGFATVSTASVDTQTLAKEMKLSKDCVIAVTMPFGKEQR